MIKTNQFFYQLGPWENTVDDEESLKLWIVNQLMGETEKGDALEFARVAEDDVELCTGVLKDKDGALKSLIPALFSRKHDGVWTEVYYNGEVIDVDADVDAAWRKVPDQGDIDQAVKDWLEVR